MKNSRSSHFPRTLINEHWWTGIPKEIYWCEITDRDDIGTNLKCPQSDEGGGVFWSYALICEIWPGDTVFHYSTTEKAIVGASTAGAPLEKKPIIWAPHGTVGRRQPSNRSPRPGWWLPLHNYLAASSPLSLRQLQSPTEQDWIRAWVEKRRTSTSLALPFQMYPGKIRAAQGYLTKMPFDYVQRWQSLADLSEALESAQAKALGITEEHPPLIGSVPWISDEFKPKADSDYIVILDSTVQRRTRAHEKLVRGAGELLKKAGAIVATPHPRDLFVSHPVKLIIEAKVLGSRHPNFAIREAVGQLLEYRHFVGPRDAQLCVLLDGNPGQALIEYLEEILGFYVLWLENSQLFSGVRTKSYLGLSITSFDSSLI